MASGAPHGRLPDRGEPAGMGADSPDSRPVLCCRPLPGALVMGTTQTASGGRRGEAEASPKQMRAVCWRRADGFLSAGCNCREGGTWRKDPSGAAPAGLLCAGVCRSFARRAANDWGLKELDWGLKEADVLDAALCPCVSPAWPFLGSPAGAAHSSGGCDGGGGHRGSRGAPSPICCAQCRTALPRSRSSGSLGTEGGLRGALLVSSSFTSQ